MNPEMRPYTAPLDNYRVPNMEEEPDGELEGALERFLAQELGNPPFDLELNAASFNYMSKDELHEILDKVLETVSPETMESIYSAENKTEQILEFLEILSYPGLTGDHDSASAAKSLKAGIDCGDVNILTGVMAWLLANMGMLQTRAYLSKFLTRIEIPDEIFYEDDVLALNEKYEAEIEKFKTTLKRKEALMNKKPLAEVKEDVALIQQDIDCLRRKIDMVKTKVRRSQNFEEDTIAIIRNLRFQKQKQFDLNDQEASEITRERQMADRMEYLKTIFRDLYSSNQCLTVKSLMDRQKHEIIASHDIVEVKLPRCIGQLRRKIKAIKTVIEDPPRTVNDLENTKISIQVIQAECNRLETVLDFARSREVSKDVLNAKSKAEIAEARKNELIDEFQSLEDSNEIAKTRLTERSVEVLGKRQRIADEQEYVKKLRAKAKIYKDKKAELNAIRTEFSILQKTYESLEMDLKKSGEDMDPSNNNFAEILLNQQRAKLEQKSIERSNLNERQEGTMAEYSEKIVELNKELEERKDRLKPLLQIVNSARKETLILEIEYRHLLQNLLEVQEPHKIRNLESELCDMREAMDAIHMQHCEEELKLKFKILELERATEGNCSTGRGRSFKERLLGKIVEQERVHRDLIQEEKDLEHTATKNEVQQKLFNDLNRSSLEC